MSQSFITLLSDLGVKDPGVAAIKAALATHAPDSTVVDISHGVKQYDLRQAAYFLLSAYGHFPEGSIHICLTDIFAGDTPHLILALREGHYFIAPDNGLLPLAFGEEWNDTRSCYKAAQPHTFRQWVDQCMAVVPAIIARDISFYSPCNIAATTSLLQPRSTGRALECNVLYVDRYENITLDITQSQFEQARDGRSFRIMLRKMDDITAISENYSDAPEGKALCRFNTAGFLELSINHGKAASLLGFSHENAGMSYPVVHIHFM